MSAGFVWRHSVAPCPEVLQWPRVAGLTQTGAFHPCMAGGLRSLDVRVPGCVNRDGRVLWGMDSIAATGCLCCLVVSVGGGSSPCLGHELLLHPRAQLLAESGACLCGGPGLELGWPSAPLLAPALWVRVAFEEGPLCLPLLWPFGQGVGSLGGPFW